jgi:ABC-2 type transport system ATP-binding protein
VETPEFYPFLTPNEILSYLGRLRGMGGADLSSRIKEVLHLVKLDDWAGVRIEKFSRGMKQRLAFAQALLHDPPILILDEPTLGLDIKNAEIIRDLLKTLKCTILLTTHYLNEAIMLCDRIGIILHGKLMYIDTPENLKRNYAGNRVFLIDTNDNQVAKMILTKNPFVNTVIEKNTKLEVHLNKCNNYFDVLNDIQDLKLLQFQELDTGLEGLFFDIDDERNKGN